MHLKSQTNIWRCIFNGKERTNTKKYSAEFKLCVILELRQRFPLKELLELSKLPRSTYYYHLKQSKVDKYSMVKQEIENIFTENKQRYGYRRKLLALQQKWILLNHKTVHKLMRSMGLRGKRRKSKYKSYKGEVGKIAPNVINRNFETNKLYHYWNNERISLTLNGMSPVQYRTHSQAI